MFNLSFGLDFEKLYQTALKIKNTQDTSMFYFRDLIRELGIFDDGRLIYFEENKYINSRSGIWQEPSQFGSLLSFLTNQTGNFADSLRRCGIALKKCCPYRLTPEFEKLIDLNYWHD